MGTVRVPNTESDTSLKGAHPWEDILLSISPSLHIGKNRKW